MRIIITAEEAIDRGIWEEAAKISGYGLYAIKEGMDPNTEITLTEEQAIELGLIKRSV